MPRHGAGSRLHKHFTVSGRWVGGPTLVWPSHQSNRWPPLLGHTHTPPPSPHCLAAELELEEGDVLANKQQVWDCAVSQAALFRDHLELLREQGFDFDADAVVAEA